MRILALFILIISFPVKAEFYKCVVNGKSTFSDRPCAEDSEKIEIKVYRPETNKISSTHERTERMTFKSKIYRVKSRIKSKEREIKRYRIAMDRELSDLKDKKRFAANNSSGATWEISISNEMESVVAKYNSKISGAEGEIKHYRRELSDLQSQE